MINVSASTSFAVHSTLSILFRQILDTSRGGCGRIIYGIKIDEATTWARAAAFIQHTFPFRDLMCETTNQRANSQAVLKAVRRATLRMYRERPVIATALTVYVKEGPKVQ